MGYELNTKENPMTMTYEEIFHTMTEEEVRYSLDALQEANRRLLRMLQNEEVASQNMQEEIERLKAELA
tara:strand:+ start:338 stop:544 length:207 start_codon:yes stop_codon:yes gene_type:complete